MNTQKRPTPPAGEAELSREWTAFGLRAIAYKLRAGTMGPADAHTAVGVLLSAADAEGWLPLDDANAIVQQLRDGDIPPTAENLAKSYDLFAEMIEGVSEHIVVDFFTDEDDDDERVAAADLIEQASTNKADASELMQRIDAQGEATPDDIGNAGRITAETIRTATGAFRLGAMTAQDFVTDVSFVASAAIEAGLLDRQQYVLHTASVVSRNPDDVDVAAWADGVAALVLTGAATAAKAA